MDNKKKSFLAPTLIATAILGGTTLNANTNSLFSFNELGSGAEVRTVLATNGAFSDRPVLHFEMKCGNDAKVEKAESKSKTEKAESKSKDAKCGEGKCGEGDSKDKASASKDKKAEAKTEKKTESKSSDAKCGEGKCGN